MADNFCKYCGTEHTSKQVPQQCGSCQGITWVNPTPVAAILVPVMGYHEVTDRHGTHWKRRMGVLLGQRGIHPKMGEWNLPAGFVDVTDTTIQGAAVRELFEETGFVVDPKKVAIDHSFCDGRVMLFFCKAREVIQEADLHKFVINHECPAVRVAWEPEKLCFDSHSRALAAWFT